MPRTPRKQSTSTVLGKRTPNALNIPTPPQSPAKVRARRSAAKEDPVQTLAIVKQDLKENAAQLPTPPVTPSKRKVQSESDCTPKTGQRLRDVTNNDRLSKHPPSETRPATPATASTPSIYTGAKALFQRGSVSAGKLLCRDVERDALQSFFFSHISTTTGGSLYVSGPPGTGKSALMAEVLNDVKEKFGETVKVANINCMTVRKPSLVFCTIYQELVGEELLECDDELSITDNLEQYFTKSTARQSCIVILDEMDSLITRDQEILYQVFEWTRLKNSKLVLVGIANALNLTSRFLPKLKARNFVPEVLRFTPYTAEQIATVISARLEVYSRAIYDNEYEKYEATALMHPAAIQLCARKTAANTGDIRKAFDICKRGLDLAEEDARRKYSQQSNTDCQENRSPMLTPSPSPSRSPAAFIIPADAVPPKVTISHIAKICSSAFGGSTAQRLQSLNLQQKAVLCALVVGEKRKHSSLTIRELYEHYGALCAKDKLLDRLKASEFREVITALEVCGVINLSAAGRSCASGKDANGDDRRISAAVQAIDLLRAVEDVGMLKRFFSGGA
ncbi:P-loop containing nucleoside triphosphate hydrolase protein [Lipomyces kononenkoae]